MGGTIIKTTSTSIEFQRLEHDFGTRFKTYNLMKRNAVKDNSISISLEFQCLPMWILFRHCLERETVRLLGVKSWIIYPIED